MPAHGIAAVPVGLHSHFLEGLTPSERRTMLAAATKRQFAARSVITNQDHPAGHFYLLTKGFARYFIVTKEGKKLLFQWIGPGDLLGGRSALSKPSCYLFSAETITDASALVWDRPTIRSLVSRFPRLLENALLTASDFLSWHLNSYVGLACYTPRHRMAEVLITLARTIGQEVPGGVEIQITNEELASAANVTPFTASRVMSQWQRDRALQKRRGKLLLRSPERLFLRAI